MRTSMRAPLLLMLLGANLTAQTGAAPDAPQRLFVDGVVASINDVTILQSRLFATAEGRIKGIDAQSPVPLSLAQLAQLYAGELMEQISHYQMAQSAKSFAPLPPDQIDRVLDVEMKRVKEDEVRDLGTYLALSEELLRRGQTWPSYEQERRIDLLHSLALQFAVNDRLRKQLNLYLTPRMLRETYQRNVALFVHDADALVDWVTFKGADAEAKAAAAAEFWKTGDWTARQVAERNAGGAVVAEQMGTSGLRPVHRPFALAGPLGEVSAPIDRGDGNWDVLRIVRYTPAANARFEDPAVQENLRAIAGKLVYQEFLQQALERARQRTEAWIYQNGVRIRPRPVR